MLTHESAPKPRIRHKGITPSAAILQPSSIPVHGAKLRRPPTKKPVPPRPAGYRVPDEEVNRALEFARIRGDRFAARAFVPGMERPDIVQEAVYAVLKAAETYNPLHPSRASFQSWAVTQVSAGLLEMCRKHSQMPRSTYDKVKAWLTGLAQGETPEELEARGLTAPAECTRVPLSLDEVLAANRDGHGGRAGQVTDAALGPEALTLEGVTAEEVRRAVGRLPERWALIVGEYYWEGRTMKAIAKGLGISESRVFQILQQAHSKLARDLGGRV